MKRIKIISTALLLLITCSLAGCSSPAAFWKEEGLFSLAITQNTDSPVYAIHYEYFIAGDAVGGGITCNADGTMIAPGDVLYASFEASDFPAGSDLSAFSVCFFIVDEAGNETPAGSPVSISAVRGSRYRVSLEGNENDGFQVLYS